MKKLFMVAFVALLMGWIALPASADSINLVQNASFENWSGDPPNFEYWREPNPTTQPYRQWDVTDLARTGDYAAMLYYTGTGTGSNSGLVSSRFDIPEIGTYEYGAWFKFITDVDPALLPGWPSDRPGTTLDIYAGGVKLGGDATIVNISAYRNASWTQDGAYWVSDDWFLIAGTFEVGQICQGELNIYIQEYNNAALSIAIVDDAFVQRVAPVPEPATLMLLGTGLIGLAGLRRKFKK